MATYMSLQHSARALLISAHNLNVVSTDFGLAYSSQNIYMDMRTIFSRRISCTQTGRKRRRLMPPLSRMTRRKETASGTQMSGGGPACSPGRAPGPRPSRQRGTSCGETQAIMMLCTDEVAAETAEVLCGVIAGSQRSGISSKN